MEDLRIHPAVSLTVKFTHFETFLFDQACIYYLNLVITKVLFTTMLKRFSHYIILKKLYNPKRLLAILLV